MSKLLWMKDTVQRPRLSKVRPSSRKSNSEHTWAFLYACKCCVDHCSTSTQILVPNSIDLNQSGSDAEVVVLAVLGEGWGRLAQIESNTSSSSSTNLNMLMWTSLVKVLWVNLPSRSSEYDSIASQSIILINIWAGNQDNWECSCGGGHIQV